MNSDSLLESIRAIQGRSGFEGVGVAVFDYERGESFDADSSRWFHAASVMKLAVLLALFKAAEQGSVRLDDPLHVRNRFRSVADGSPFRLESDRDGDEATHRRLGRTMKLAELAHAMITRSSNLATNLLLDWLTVERVGAVLAESGVEGVKVVRGVEDHVAFQRGLNNEMTPAGAVQMLRLLCEGEFFSEFSRHQMRDILLAQEFNSMIPARLPSRVKVAHKTGEISTHCHDAGIVFFPDRKPYVVAIFTQGPPMLDQRQRSVAEISSTVFEAITA